MHNIIIIDTWIEEIGSPRKFFGDLIQRKLEVEQKHLDFGKENNNNESFAIAAFISGAIFVLYNNNIPIIFKSSKGILKLISKYERPHLINSLIKEIIDKSEINHSYVKNAQNIVIILYYWNFFRKNNIDDLINSVIIDLEHIISTIISKEKTLYKNKNTDPIISALQDRREALQLISEGTKQRTINFRRCNI